MNVLFAVASCVSENMTFFPPWRGLAVGCVASPWLSWHSFLGFEAVAVAVAVQTHDFPSQTQQLIDAKCRPCRDGEYQFFRLAFFQSP